MRLIVALGIWVVAGVMFYLTDVAPPTPIEMAHPVAEKTGEIFDLVEELFVTTRGVVDENRESGAGAAAAMVWAAAIGSLVGLWIYGLVLKTPRLWPLRSMGVLLCVATLAMVWVYGRASLIAWPSDALGSGAVGIVSMTMLFLAGLISWFSTRSHRDSHDPRVPATA